MIPVTPAEEPADFDARVRQRGLDAIAELVGERPSRKRRGPKRKNTFARREEIPPDEFPPLWRDVLPEMLQSYRRICAYIALYIEPVTGNPTVDHAIPKSRDWRLVYEWSNYRLACGLMNTRKNNLDGVLDPFRIEHDWFSMEFVSFQLRPGPGAVGTIEEQVENTIEILGLNDPECCEARAEYVKAYQAEDPIPFSHIERRAPLIARELRRQDLLRPEDR